MKMELTARDIKLLKITLTLLITVLMVRFLIVPAVERYQDRSFEREELKTRQEEMQFQIDQLPAERADMEKTRTELSELTASCYEMMDQSEIDELVTGLAYKHGLFPSRLDIGACTDAVLAPYLYSERLYQEKADSAGNGETAKEDAGRQETNRYIQFRDAAITLVGEEKNALGFLEDLEKNYPSVQIKSFDMSRKSYMNTSMKLVEETQMCLVLTVYMQNDWNKSE